jgi:hypothetical protein
MARHRTVFCVPVAVLWQLLASADVRAYEDQASLDVALDYVSLLESVHLPEQGAGVNVGAAVGISDIAVVRGLVGYAALPDRQRTAHLGRVRAEALYLVDVLQFVPFFGLGAGLFIAQQRDASVAFLPVGHFVFGADYLLSRQLTLGIDVRAGMLIERGEIRSTNDVSLRISRLFELF